MAPRSRRRAHQQARERLGPLEGLEQMAERRAHVGIAVDERLPHLRVGEPRVRSA